MLIAFAGCDGSGKSTQVKNTATWLREKGFQVEILDKWDILDQEKFPECRFIHTELEDLRVCIAEMEGISRAMFLFWSISITLTKNDLYSKNKFYLLDGYWMKHAASEIVYNCSEEWILKTVQQLPQPDLVLFFDVPPEIALKRKKSLTPYECGRKLDFTEQDFLDHQTKVYQLLSSWCDTYSWHRILGSKPVEEIFLQVQEVINKKIEGISS